MQIGSTCSPPAVTAPRSAWRPLADRVDTAGPYRITVERRAASAAAVRALRAAEAVPPPRAAVLAAGGRLSPEDSVAPNLWWSDTFDRVRLPFAVTGAAAQYYADLTDAYRRGGTGALGEIHMRTSRVVYRAAVEEHATWPSPPTVRRDVSIVRMSLAWGGMCSDMCGQATRKTRTVVVSARGDTVLAVCGDGRPEVDVSVRSNDALQLSGPPGSIAPPRTPSRGRPGPLGKPAAWPGR